MKNKKDVSFRTVQFIAGLTKVLRPKEPLTVSEWADRFMVLPAGSNESGHFSTDNAPYQKAIMDAVADPEVREVSVMSSAQVGKTTVLLCVIGYYIQYEPSTMLMVLPTLNLSERFSKTRLAAMISDIPELSERVAPVKTRDSNNTILFKSYPGGHIVLAGANSPASLSSMPIRVILMDEVDRFPESAGSEGNPIMLAEARATSFWNKKYVKTSTPTIAGHSKIEDSFKKGTMERYCVACPVCGEFQTYDFRRLDFDSLSMTCEFCGELIEERDWKSSEHKWIAEHPERKDHRSFHLNQMVNPYVDWKDIVRQFLDAKHKADKLHDMEDLKVFINTVLGECWEEADMDESHVEEDVLEERAEHYDADIPDGVIVLTAAVDVQDNRFEVEVRGWAREYETWGIYKTEIYGKLEEGEIWEELEEYLGTTFRFRDGRELNVAAVCIDTGGHHTNQVYRWIKLMKNKGKRVYGIKGYAGKPDIPLLHHKTSVEISDLNERGEKIVVDRTYIQIIGVDAGKESIMNQLKITEPGERYCHFPSNGGRGYDSEYYRGLLSESKIYKKVSGKYKYVWVKKAGARNEPLDLFNYNYAAVEMLRPVWGALEAKLENGINYMKNTTVKKKIRRTYENSCT